jgi:hydrogenase maturation protease
LPRISILGIGNVLTGDDGVGSTVVRTLEAEYALPEDVELLDAGTPGLDLTAYITGRAAVIFVDAVKAQGAPGELRCYDKAALLRKAPVLAMSPHEPGLREALMNAEFIGGAPPVATLVGVIPTATAFGIGLSAPVRAAVPAAVDRVLEELRALGVEPVRRVPPRTPDLWWEKPQG